MLHWNIEPFAKRTSTPTGTISESTGTTVSMAPKGVSPVSPAPTTTVSSPTSSQTIDVRTTSGVQQQVVNDFSDVL